jgi:hypothetical protein
VIPVNDVLRRYPFTVGGNGDRYAMLIGTPDVDDILAPESHVSDIDICRKINAGEMAEMYRPVGIG